MVVRGDRHVIRGLELSAWARARSWEWNQSPMANGLINRAHGTGPP